ncbi:MAG: YcxB family protein [Clostridia bacterium]|nr:YcxB family protein [Clostridia bacterium]
MIEFKTQLDAIAQKALNKMGMKKLIKIFIVFSLIIIGIGIFGVVIAEDNADKSTGIYLIIVGVIIIPILLILNAIGQRTVKKTSPFLQNPTKEIYRFTEDGIEHLQKRGESFFSQTKADYTYFYKVISTPTHYFMYIGANQCHVIDKTHITQGTCEELDAILTRKLPEGKFKKTKR